MRDQFVSSVSNQLAANFSTFLLTGDLGFGIFDSIQTKFPQQFINTGVAEQNLTSIAAGLALDGCHVFTYSIGNFNTLRCYEQIRNDVVYHNCNVTIVTVGAGFSYGQLGMSHFAIEDIGVFRLLPDLRIFAPSSSAQMASCMSFIANNPGPSYLRIDKSTLTEEHLYSDSLIRPQCHMSGNDVLILSYGGIVQEAIDAANRLSQDSISCSVYSIPLLKPFPSDFVSSLLISHKLVVTLEEHMITGGLFSAISELKSLRGLNGPVLPFAIPSCYPSVVGDQIYLRKHFGLDSQTVYQSVLYSFLHA